MRSRVAVALFFASSAVISVFAACGLDESGLVGDASVIGSEGGQDVVFDVPIDVPQACSTLDASACFDGALPSGWTFVALAAGSQACPGEVGDYTQQTYYASPKADAGACTCGCTPVGSYSCAGVVHAGSQSGSCNGVTEWIEAGDTPGCFPTPKVDPNLSVGPAPAPIGAVGCDASVTVNQVWNATEVTACTPACTADYCGVAGFSRCVATTTGASCFGPFTQQRRIGPASAIAVTCSPCGCGVSPAACGATVEAFTSADCGAGTLGTIGADASCNNFGGGNNAASFRYTPVIPTPQCTPSGEGGVGSADFAQFITVCCIP